MIYVLGSGWPSEENKKAWQAETCEINTGLLLGTRFVSYFLRFFCAILSLNFVYSPFTGSIYINLVSRQHASMKQISFNESPYIFGLAFVFSGYVFLSK